MNHRSFQAISRVENPELLDLVIVSDVHGRLISDTTTEMKPSGLDRLSTYLKNLRSKGNTVFLINNGDIIQGSPLVDLHNFTQSDVEPLNHPVNIVHEFLGVNCFIPGNHEFNFGLDYLLTIHKFSKTPWLAANIFSLATQKPLFEPYRLFEINGIKIGVLGLVTDFVPKWESSLTIKGLEFVNAVEIANTCISRIRPLCDFLIVAYHGGLKADPASGETWNVDDSTENQALDIWKCSNDIDLLITGHQHRKLVFFPKDGNRCPIVQPSAYANHWIHLKLRNRSSASIFKSSVLRSKIYLDKRPGMVNASSLLPDPTVSHLLKPHVKIIENLLKEPLGIADSSCRINNAMDDVWLKKHPLTEWINNLMSATTGVSVAAIPLLSPNLKGLEGEIKVGDILSYFFFQDTLCVIEITGHILKSALEKAAGFFFLRSGKNGERIIDINPDWRKSRVLSYNYDIWNGIDYCFDIRKPVGKRLISLKKNDVPINDDQVMEVAVTSYRSAGAFYTMFSPKFIKREYPIRITDLMINDLKQHPKLNVIPNQNFKIIF